MTLLLAEIPISIIEKCDKVEPLDGEYILDHLVYYCSKFSTLPAITVSVDGPAVRVIRGQVYIRVAQRLNRSLIRAVLTTTSSTNVGIQQLLSRHDVAALEWGAIRDAEAREPEPHQWHVVFFERPTTQIEEREFSNLVNERFGSDSVDVVYDHSGPLVEFQAKTPVTNHEWAAGSLSAFGWFSSTRNRIVSYQGRRFRWAQGDIRNLGVRFRGRIDASILADALEYLDHNECALALEVLAEKLCDEGVELSVAECEEFDRIAASMGVPNARFQFLRNQVGRRSNAPPGAR